MGGVPSQAASYCSLWSQSLLAGCAGKSIQRKLDLFEQSQGCFPTHSLATLGVPCLGRKVPPGSGCAPACSLTVESSQVLCALLRLGSAWPSAGLWVPRAQWRFSAHALSVRMRTVGRREELGLESRGPGFAFPLYQQLPRQSSRSWWNWLYDLRRVFQPLCLSALICTLGIMSVLLPHKAAVSTKWEEVGKALSKLQLAIQLLTVNSPNSLRDLGKVTPISGPQFPDV